GAIFRAHNNISVCLAEYLSNGSWYRTLNPFGVQLAMYLTCALSTLIMVLGSLPVIITVSHCKALHSPTNLPLLSLDPADVLLGLTVLPFSTILSRKSCWYFGGDFCRLHTFLDTLFCLTSIFHLCFIFINWHCAICDPLLYPTFTKRLLAPAAVGLRSQSVDLDDVKVTRAVDSCYLLFNKIWEWLNFPLFFPCLIQILHVGAFKRKRKAANSWDSCRSWLPLTIDTMVDILLDFITHPVMFGMFIWKAVKLVLTHWIFCSRTSRTSTAGMTRAFLYSVENIVGCIIIALLVNICQHPLS
uniref:Trace amine associated receptor 5 n=1 Tax=Falco tinnunculus TaxID=100819 RepID=A0A8C4UYF9_FALTI